MKLQEARWRLGGLLQGFAGNPESSSPEEEAPLQAAVTQALVEISPSPKP